MSGKGPSYSFIVEWYDQYATVVRVFTLIYHEGIKSVEMHDHKFNKIFLKPTKIEDLKLSDFYPGSTVTILSRSLKVVDFADNVTRKALSSNYERYLLFVRAGSVCKAGHLIASLEKDGFRLVNLKLVCLSPEELRKLTGGTVNGSKFPHLVTEVADKLVLALEVMGNRAFERIVQKIGGGNLDSETGYIMDANWLAMAQTADLSLCQSEMIFGTPGGPNFLGLPRLKETTLCVIKPHAVCEGLTGQIWEAIQSREFCVTAARLFRLSKQDASEFLEVYKGVVHEYPEMLDQMASGPCVALEIAKSEAGGGDDTQQTFREFVGPADPEIGRFLRPDTLRARFGVDKVRNAVHCTDLPDDSQLEVNFFFRVLDK